jgi:hypothetical protein
MMVVLYVGIEVVFLKEVEVKVERSKLVRRRLCYLPFGYERIYSI